MKKFDQINKHMNANKTKPINKKCTVCAKNDWLVWRNDFMYYDTLNKCLISVEDDEELEEAPKLEQIDFALYVCPECGAWSTSIS